MPCAHRGPDEMRCAKWVVVSGRSNVAGSLMIRRVTIIYRARVSPTRRVHENTRKQFTPTGAVRFHNARTYTYAYVYVYVYHIKTVIGKQRKSAGLVT